MNKSPFTILLITIILVSLMLTGLSGCGKQADFPATLVPDSTVSAPTLTQGATQAPLQTPTQTPTQATLEPTPDTKVLAKELATALQSEQTAVPVTEAFLIWLSEKYGQNLLQQLKAALSAGDYSDSLWYSLTGNSLFVLSDLFTGAAEQTDNIHFLSEGNPTGENSVTTMTFGGDICFADNYVVMQYLKTTENGITDCIDPDLIAQMRNADIAYLNNEFTISDRGSPMKGKAYTFRAATEHTDLYNTLGVDIVSLANNHIFDFGADAFSDTLDALKQYGIAGVGGGRNLEEAQKPVYYLVNGRKIAFVAASRAEKHIMTPEATETSGGVLRCYDTALFLETIREAKANSDYVIACVHWGTEHTSKLEAVQQNTAYDYIDAGADLIIGAHAHQLQGIEYYKGKAIFYNLGNFWFDHYDIETGLVKLELASDGTEQFTFLPAKQKNCVTTSEMGTETGNRILAHLQSYSAANVTIDENGVISQK